MNEKFRYLLLVFLSFMFASLQAAAPQYENQPIDKIEIFMESSPDGGNHEVRSSIKSRLTTREGSFFSQADFDNDLKLLANDFDQVEPQLESMNGKLTIVLKIWAKPRIRAIRWVGNVHVSSDTLLSELGIKCFTTFDRLAFNKAFHKIKAYYIKQGYFEAELNYEVILDSCSNEVDIEVGICEGRAGRIKNIVFCGFTKKEESDLVDMIMTKEYNFLFSWYTGEGIYHEEAVQQDQFIVLNYLQNLGYADAKVDIEIQEACSNKINIHIIADKGEIYRVSGIEFSGNELFCDNEIWKAFTIRRGSPYSPEKIRQTISNVTDLYGRKGYIDANIDFEPILDIDCLTYSLKMTIEEGNQYRVGMIKVFGNCTTQTNIILHESVLIPGEIFNIEKLKLTEQKLLNVGYFATVNVYAVRSEGPLGLGEHYRDVHIEVKETSTGHFGAFFGYSTAESVFGGLNITERNFNYRGIPRVLQEGFAVLRGGGEYAHATIQLGLKSRKYVISWAKPFFRDTQWTVGFDLEQSNNRYIADDYEINSSMILTHASYKINEFVRFGWHYRLKNSNVDVDHKKRQRRLNKQAKAAQEAQGAQPDQPVAKGAEAAVADAVEKGKDHYNRELVKDSEIDGLISASGISLTYDSTDHPVLPRSGFKSRLELEYAGIGGDHTFFSVGYLNSYFIPLGKKSVLKYRFDFRFVLPYGNTKPTTLPIDERLFLGGDVLVRGYRSYRLGPLYPHSDDPRGGVSEQYYSIELTRKAHPKIEAFIFFDAGYLSLRRFKFGTPYCSVGMGARVKIIESIPSLTLGMGAPLNPRKSTQVKKFFISVGGEF